MKKLLVLGIILTLMLGVSIVTVIAGKPDLIPTNVNTPKGPVSIIIPEHAIELAPGIFSLGEAQDVNGRIVQGFLFIDYKEEFAKPPWAGGGKGGSSCYEFLARGARWKTTEPYVTGNGIDLTLTETSLETWDSEIPSFNIFGTGTAGTTNGADDVSPDGDNEVMFEDLGETSTIAYTIVWGIFRGPPSGRELVEWDAVFNSDYAWSLNGEEGKMDYQNIATHEFGHAAGMGHPDDSCTEETMYRFASLGETKKRSLEAGDITGISELYA